MSLSDMVAPVFRLISRASLRAACRSTVTLVLILIFTVSASLLTSKTPWAVTRRPGHKTHLLFGFWDRADPATVFEALDERPSLKTLAATLATRGLVFLSAMIGPPRILCRPSALLDSARSAHTGGG